MVAIAFLFAACCATPSNPALRMPAYGYAPFHQVNVWRGEGEKQGQP